jgi:IS5 family transposase
MYSFEPSGAKLIGLSESDILEKAVGAKHPFRTLTKSIDLNKIARGYRNLYSKTGAKAIPIERAVRMLAIQFLEDYSDRQMERAVEENMAIRWFCGYELTEETPDHSFFGDFRKRLGTKNLGIIFKTINKELKDQGLIGETFSFVDSTGIVTKTALWDERDKALAEGEAKLNNLNIKKFAADSQARFGCKGKNKYHFGYKRHHCVDMKQGMITKVAVTPANVLDDEAFELVCPDSGAAFLDKGYDTPEARKAAKIKGIHFLAIKRNNRKDKNRDLDDWVSKTRMPEEGNFSKISKRARYRTTAKVQFQAFAQAICYNLKRLIKVTQIRAFGST